VPTSTQASVRKRILIVQRSLSPPRGRNAVAAWMVHALAGAHEVATVTASNWSAEETNALYGALLSLRDGADDQDQIARWAALGGRAFAREARLRDTDKKPVLLSFPGPLAKDATTALRQAGFRFSKVMQHWEGLARFAEAETLAQAHGGAVRRVSAGVDEPTAAAAE
jgi:hypothetical protein